MITGISGSLAFAGLVSIAMKHRQRVRLGSRPAATATCTRTSGDGSFAAVT